ncbi:MAG TPA: glycosyltransferase family A protein [Pyrinomonadaceae bacterium]
MSDSLSKKDSPLVSVIIPAYKVAPFIRETLDSVLDQPFTDLEVIVINDGSPDTEELEAEIEDYRERIIYLKQSNLGAGAARNFGLRTARGEFVAFLDGDDTWLPGFLLEQFDLLKGGKGFDLVYADAVNFGEPATEGTTSMATNPSEGEVTFEALVTSTCSVLTSTVLTRRDLVLKVGLFDESLPNSQDFDLWLRLLRDAGARMTYQRKVLVRRRLYAGSLASDGLKSLNGEIAVLKKLLRRSDLSQAERKLIEKTIELREAVAERTIGKRSLIAGDFSSASESLRRANRVLNSWKLRFIIMGLHIAPTLMQRASRLRPN